MEIKISTNQIKNGEVTFEEIRSIFERLGINSYDKLSSARTAHQLKLPEVGALKALCLKLTGVDFKTYFQLTQSTAKQARNASLFNDAFVREIKDWCEIHGITSEVEYAAHKSRPKEFPSVELIRRYGGEDYFHSILGLARYKATIEDRILDQQFIEMIREWCVQHNVTSISEYLNCRTRPASLPSAERLRQLYGKEYFYEVLGFTKGFEYLPLQDARKLCLENGVYTFNAYAQFRAKYNSQHEIKLPHDLAVCYQMNWRQFISLSPTQLFIGQHMSNLELFTYKLLHDHDLQFETEKTFDDLRNQNLLRCDFFLPDYNLLIELDGAQHFETSSDSLFYSPKTQLHDRVKDEYAERRGIRLVRINRIVDIQPALEDAISLSSITKKYDLDWTTDFIEEHQILNSNLSKSLKVKLLLLMEEKGKIVLSNAEIISKTLIKKPTFYAIKNELIALSLISRQNEYHFTEEEKEELLVLYQQGTSISEIMRRTGYKNRAYLIKYLESRGVYYRKKMSTPPDLLLERKTSAFRLYQEGISQSSIANQLSVSKTFVSLAIKEMMIKAELRQVSPDQLRLAAEIKRLRDSGNSWRQTSEKTGYSVPHLKTCLMLVQLAGQDSAT